MKLWFNRLRLVGMLLGKRFILVLLLGMSVFLMAGCKKERAEAPASQENTTPSVEKPKNYVLKKETFTPQVELTGTVEADKQVTINSAISGRVAEIYVETGDFVRKGQILARLSAHDNSAEIQYQNALNTLSKAKNTVDSNIYQAEVNLNNAQLSLDKTIRTQKEIYENTFELLITQATSTGSTLKDVYHWADRTVLASEEAKRGTSDPMYYNLGANQTVDRQRIQNDVQALYNIYKKEQEDKKAPRFVPSAEGEKIVLDYAQEHLEVARKLRDIAFRINSLIVRTSTHSNFSTNQRLQLQQESDGYLKTIDNLIVTLDNGIKNATSQREAYQEAILVGENQVRAAETGLDLVKASSEGEINNAKNQVRIAQLSRDELTLEAPFSGVIISKNVESGQLVNAGTALLEIADMSKFKIKTDIPDVWVGDTKNENLTTEIRISGIRDKVFLGEIDKIEPAVDPTTRKVGIEIVFDEPDEIIKIGMFARILVMVPETEGFFVPRKFLKSDFDGAYIKLADGTKKHVEKGFENDNKIQIYFSDAEEGIELID